MEFLTLFQRIRERLQHLLTNLTSFYAILAQRRTVTPAYLFANVEVTDAAGYEQYRQRVSATIEAFGGRYLVRGGATEVLEGIGSQSDWLSSSSPTWLD